MLKYNIKLTEPNYYNEIEYSNLYLSPDLSYISGVTDSKYDLTDGQHLKLEFNLNNVFHDVIVNVKNSKRQGYVNIKKTFNLEEYKDYIGFFHLNGKYYFCKSDKNEINVEGEKCKVNTKNKTIDCTVTYFIDDNKVTIDDVTYDVNIQYIIKQNNNNTITYEVINEPYIILKNGDVIKVTTIDVKNITKFYIKKSSDFDLKIDFITTASLFDYFIYNNKKHYLKCITSENKDSTSKYDVEYINNDNENITFKQLTNNNNNLLPFVYGIDEDNNKFTIPLNSEWQSTSNGKKLLIYVDNTSYTFNISQKIIVESIDNTDITYLIRYDDEKKYIIVDGVKYYSNNDKLKFININEILYQLHFTKNNVCYIILNNMPLYLELLENGKKAKRISIASSLTDKEDEKIEYEILEYEYITINNINYLIKNTIKHNYDDNNEQKIEFITVNKKHIFNLLVKEVISNNCLICEFDVEDEENTYDLCNVLSNNNHGFTFKLENKLFNEYNVSKESYITEFEKGEKILDTIKIYNSSYFLKLRLPFTNNAELNLQKEDILTNLFFKEEVKNSINNIVDMERKVYYPCNHKNKDFTLINEIIFDLHFRSRNLDTWKINEDVYNGTKTEIKHNWNLFDYYDYNKNNKEKPSITEINSYYQPSDLLYFLNFTNDDVFYQKSKIGKSFLRLSFFDSIDVSNQTLLYTCTVWMDEGMLYKTYTDNIIKDSDSYISVNPTANEKGLNIISSIGVDNEKCDENKNILFDEENRLSSRFIVKNRYESHESAEGFYLYIFEEYCEKKHENTIYMKIEFNHAGEGRTVNMTMPFKYNKDGDVELMNLSPNSEDYNEFLKGYDLKELYEHLFIPIKVVYDGTNNRYCYYLPEGLVKHDNKDIMKFNLYELKIKDDSEEK